MNTKISAILNRTTVGSAKSLLAPLWRRAIRAIVVLIGLALFVLAEKRIANMISSGDFFTVVFWHVIAIIAFVTIAYPFWGYAIWFFISKLISLFFMSLGAKYNPDFLMIGFIAIILVLKALGKKTLSIKKFSSAEVCLLLYFVYSYILRDNIRIGGLANLAGVLNTWILCPAGLYFIVKNTITEKKHIIYLMLVIILVGVTWALFGIYEQWTGNWWISKVVGVDLSLGGDKRSSGPAGHYYLYGNMLILAILMCLHFYSWQKRWLPKVALVLSSGVCVVGLYFGYSRAPYIAFIISLFVMLALTRKTRRIYIGIWAVIGLISLVIIPVMLHSPQFRERLFANTVDARVYITNTSINMFKANMLFGVGREKYQESVPTYMDYRHLRSTNPKTGLTSYYSRPHSEYFGKLAELGIVGFVLYFGIFFLFMSRFMRFRSSLSKDDIVGADLAMLAVAYTSSILFTMITDEFSIQMFMYAIIFTLFAMVEKARLLTYDETKGEH